MHRRDGRSFLISHPGHFRKVSTGGGNLFQECGNAEHEKMGTLICIPVEKVVSVADEW